jgi:hypothetical protein
MNSRLVIIKTAISLDKTKEAAVGFVIWIAAVRSKISSKSPRGR